MSPISLFSFYHCKLEKMAKLEMGSCFLFDCVTECVSYSSHSRVVSVNVTFEHTIVSQVILNLELTRRLAIIYMDIK